VLYDGDLTDAGVNTCCAKSFN